jgi:hypothetical protein
MPKQLTEQSIPPYRKQIKHVYVGGESFTVAGKDGIHRITSVRNEDLGVAVNTTAGRLPWDAIVTVVERRVTVYSRAERLTIIPEDTK